MKLIEVNLQKIIEICKRYKVKSMAVFGSILTSRFRDDSDIDFLIDFEQHDPDSFDYVSNFFDLQDALEALLGRKVDLVVAKAMRNPYFIENVNRTKRMIYG